MAGDRDMLGTQLVRRNDELALLYEKLRLQEATIVQGRKAYGCEIIENSAPRLLLLSCSPWWRLLSQKPSEIVLWRAKDAGTDDMSIDGVRMLKERCWVPEKPSGLWLFAASLFIVIVFQEVCLGLCLPSAVEP